MARNVGVNSTFEEQRLVINELAVDVETLENAGYLTTYEEQDNLGTVLARGNQATSDILLTGIITATSFVGDGSNLTGISAGAGGTDNVSTSTLSVAGVSTFNGRIIGAATTNIIPFLYANLSDLPSATDYHGAFAHVHATGKAYYAHSGAWVELVNAGVDGTVGTGTERYNVGVITATQFVGDGSGLTGVVAQGTGIVIQEEGSSVGTAGTINFIGAGVTATLANGIASVEITSSGSSYTNSDVDTHINVGTALTNEVLSWNGSDYNWVAQSGSGTELSNVVEDTTPQLGGNLDINSKYITGTGGANITGVVTATRFESTSAGTPTIDSPNNLNINAITVAISTNLTAGGTVTASQFVGDGSGLTGVVAQGTGIVIQEEGSSVGTAGTINFIGAGVTATIAGGIASVEITSSGGGSGISSVSDDTAPYLGGDLTTNGNDIIFGNDKVIFGSDSGFQIYDNGQGYIENTSGQLRFTSSSTMMFFTTGGEDMAKFSPNGASRLYYDGSEKIATSSTGITVTGEITANGYRTNDTVGDGTDVGFAIKYYITEDGSSSAYRFAGPGLVNTTDNPTIYLHRGFTYIFENSTGSNHPFRIQYSGTSTGYGSTYLSGSQTGTQVLTVPFDAPASLEYECTLHGGMNGTFNIVS